MRRRKSFPFWVSGPSWVFIALDLVLISGVLTLDRLGFSPDPIAALAVAALPTVAAALFLQDDWRDNRRQPW